MDSAHNFIISKILFLNTLKNFRNSIEDSKSMSEYWQLGEFSDSGSPTYFQKKDLGSFLILVYKYNLKNKPWWLCVHTFSKWKG